MKYFLIITVLLSSFVKAEGLCEKVKSQGEGHWPISEAAFTKEKAGEALGELTELFSKSKGELLSSKDSGGLDIDSYVKNRLVYIKGYALKSSAIEDKQLMKPEISKWSQKEFCKFLSDEAIIWH